MHIEDFKIWLDLIDTQSFSKCAKLNFLTQPAISQKIKRMEEGFKTPLFTRRDRRIDLTAAGKILYEGSRKIIDEYRGLSSRINSLSGIIQGTLKVATIYSIGLYELGIGIKVFLKKYPEVNLDIEYNHASKIYQDLLDGKIEIGCVAYPEEHSRLKIIPFKKDKLILITHPQHPLARFKLLDIHKINGQEFVGFKEGVPTRKTLDEVFKKHRISVIMKMEFDNIETIKKAVEIGLGISILPSVTVKEEIKHGWLKGVPFSNIELWRPLGIVICAKDQLSPVAEKFIEELTN